ncbi:hypothetical protein D3C81_441970 [compost metagenome]
MATIAATIRTALSQGLDNAQVLEIVKANHLDSNTSAACVSYYRSKMKKAGAQVAAAKGETKAAANVIGIEDAKAKLLAKVSGAEENVYSVDKVKFQRGQEGQGFVCKLLRNGKVVAEVIDYAMGGPFDFDWKVEGEAQILAKHVATLPQVDVFGTMMDMNDEMFVDEFINDFQLLKQFKTLTNGKIAFINAKGQLMTTRKCEVTEKNIEAVKAHNPQCQIINGMNEVDALAVMKKVAQ